MNTSSQSTDKSRQTTERKLSDDDIYMIIMLHHNQRMRSRDIARRFGISTARVRDIVARRSNSSCCG